LEEGGIIGVVDVLHTVVITLSVIKTVFFLEVVTNGLALGSECSDFIMASTFVGMVGRKR
jgi:hypothetical protein